MALWQNPSKFCTPAYCLETAHITKANLEVARSLHFEYIKEKFKVFEKITETPIDVTGEDLIPSSRIDARLKKLMFRTPREYLRGLDDSNF